MSAMFVATTNMMAAVAVSPVYGNNMVIQRDQPFRIAGTAVSNRTVTVTYNHQTNSTTADAQGNWQVTLPAMSAQATGSNFTISEAGGNTITLVNVVVGDVWLCSGQSNMAMSLGSCNRPADISSANFPGIRHFAVGLADLGDPTENLSGNWSVCSPATAGGFSAVAFYFGRQIYQNLNTNVPIGLVVSSVGGTRIDPWLAPEGLIDIPELLPLFSQRVANYGPFSLFNGMIYPLAPFAVKGLIWYQGENSETTVQSADSYFLKMRALAQGWKRFLGVDDLPFYFVQIANYGVQPADATPVLFSGSWNADTRVQQMNAMSIPHAGMASAIDIGESANMHPLDKSDLGDRLALWALKNDYGQSNLVPSGPILKDVSVSGSKAICTFDYAGNGLMVGFKQPYLPTVETNAPLALFSIAGADGIWYWATATIVGETVELTSPSVTTPQKVAYACWQNPLGANLYNRDGLPASPFYVDNITAKCTVTATSETGGSISPVGTNTYLERTAALYQITPDAGNYIQDVKVDGVSVGTAGTYVFDPLYTNHTIVASFTNVPPSFTINASVGPGGSMNPNGIITLEQGGAETFTITPNPGCLASLLVDGLPMESRTRFSLADIQANHDIAANFSCTIKASAGAGGSIIPSGTLVLPAGTNQTFTIAPNNYYQVFNVQVDGIPQGSLSAYTFTNITTPHVIGVGFALLPPRLTIAANTGGGLDITWPDIYTGSLLWSPTIGVGVSWSPVGGIPAHIGGSYKVTVTPAGDAKFYGLSQ